MTVFHRGKACAGCPGNYTVIDMEATQSPDGETRLVELAAVRVRNNLIVDTLSSLINPGCPISQEHNVSGLTDDDVADAPTAEAFLPTFFSFVGKDILCGHNTMSDISTISHTADVPLENDYIDTQQLAQSLYTITETGGFSLAALCTYFKIPNDHPHRALYDCYATYLLYTRLIPEIAKARFHLAPLPDPATADTPEYARLLQTMHLLLFAKDPFLAGKSIVLTGEFTFLNLTTTVDFIHLAGGKLQKTVTKDVHFVLVGNARSGESKRDSASSEGSYKEQRAAALGIPMLSETDFAALLRSQLAL